MSALKVAPVAGGVWCAPEGLGREAKTELDRADAQLPAAQHVRHLVRAARASVAELQSKATVTRGFQSGEGKRPRSPQGTKSQRSRATDTRRKQWVCR